jgi:putative glutamine amidotransferase
MTVQTVVGTRLADLIGPTAAVECYHHQGIAELGTGLVVAARGADGVIEAVEKPGEAFALGVQWHPEERLDDLRLFAGAVAAAAEFAMGKVGS